MGRRPKSTVSARASEAVGAGVFASKAAARKRRQPHATPNSAPGSSATGTREPGAAGFPGTDLALGSPDLRVASLLREREQLLRKIAAKDRERGRLRQSSEELSRTLQSELPPILVRQQQISKELQRLFEEILSRQLSRSARRSVRSVYDSLRRSGFISEDIDPFAADDDDFGPNPPPAPRTAHTDREHPSARHGGQWAHTDTARAEDAAKSGDALRSSFRRIAAALHPDRVQSEADKRVRTELMKELTNAYEAGDLARLLQIEERWVSAAWAGAAEGESGPDSGPDLGSAERGTWSEKRVSGLERVIIDLGHQLRTLMTEVRNLRRESPLQDLTGVRPRSRAHQAELLADFMSRANAEMGMAEGTLKFVREFAAGEISMAQFLAGPVSARRASEPDLDELFEMLLDDLEGFGRGAPKQGRRGRGR